MDCYYHGNFIFVVIHNQSMNTLLRSFNRFGTLNAQFLLNKSKNAVRFQAQNVTWDFEEANYQSQAFAKGLASLSFKKNDNFLLNVPSAQQVESYIVKLGTAAISANVILSQANTLEEVDREIKDNNIKGIIFEPTLDYGQQQYIDVLNKLIPELATTPNGSRIKSAKYPSLSALIQTNFYSFPGVYKFRSVLNYAEDRYFKLPQNPEYQAIALPESNNTIVITQPAHDFAFRAGILNSNLNGRYVVVAENRNIHKLIEAHNRKVDLVVTEQLYNLDPQITIYVPKGSNLHKDHAKRIEL